MRMVNHIQQSHEPSIQHLNLTAEEKRDPSLAAQPDYLLLLNSTTEGIYSLDREGVCTFCNAAAAKMLGYESPHQILGMPFYNSQHCASSNRTLHSLSQSKAGQAFALGEPAHAADEVFFRRDGTAFPVEYWSRPLFHESEVLGTVVTFIDISRRKRLQAQFLVAQKMETLGQMAGTIAHDFRNALSVIAGYSQLIEERLSADENGRRYARQISAAANRAATFTSQLLGLNRKQSPQPGLLDVNAMLLSMEDMLRRIVGANISLSIVLDPKSRRIWADPGHIEQLLMNLIVNARDAMPNGGELVIETSNGEPEAQPDVLPFKPAGYLLLSVSDNGCGMDHATQNRIFEPFFTTKEPGKGTGLGLSTVREIVKEYEGGIGVWSEPGIGTSFTVYLPFAADTCGPQLLSQAPGKINPSSETILVVENDEALRSLIADTLRANGYTVLESPDGNSSIALAGSYDEAIHLLLTDFVLPDITGEQAARQILASRSYTEVLFMSGYTEEYFTERGIACRGIRRLQKPFDLISMLQSVRKTLDQTCQKPRVAG
jgi:two-component system cell cycle sensor histidine kinase/response regulator CckA